jgi:riboflavin kinase/FMN adenylyltransferase
MTHSSFSQVAEVLSRVKPRQDSLLTIGVFDGVHLGHQALLGQLKKKAAERSLASGVVTFQSHPRRVLQPSNKLPFLNDVEGRLEKIRGLGIDLVVAIPFTSETARISAYDFIALLRKYLRMKGLVIGPDFALGRKREGNIETLAQLGQDMGFTVDIIKPFTIAGEVVSSTILRNTLANGDIRKTSRLLGHHFYLKGLVVAGTQHGRDLGFPTANLEIHGGQALPPNGVYVTITEIGDRRYASITNIGTRPTFGDNPQTVETYIMDFNGELYGRVIRVSFVDRLRNEVKFKSPEELKNQIARDVAAARALLSREKEAKNK